VFGELHQGRSSGLLACGSRLPPGYVERHMSGHTADDSQGQATVNGEIAARIFATHFGCLKR
jgi:hypothetical protein